MVADWPAVGSGGHSLVLNGHIDVVGPGVGEALAHAALSGRPRRRLALRSRIRGHEGGPRGNRGRRPRPAPARLAPLAPVQLQSVVEEECGGNGALQCVLSGLRPDAAVIAEPFPGVIPTSQLGVLWFHVDVAGTPAHVAYAQDGFNAIEASFPIVEELHALEAELNEAPPPPFDVLAHPINFNVGVLSERLAFDRAAECGTLVSYRALSRDIRRRASAVGRGRR